MAETRTVLMTGDAVGGVWSYALELSRALGLFSATRPIRVVLAIMGPSPSPAQREEARAAGVELCDSGGLRLEWMEAPWDDVARAGDWLLGLARDLRPDVVHLNGYCHGALPFPCPSLIVGHSCVLSWFRAVRGHEAPADWDRYRAEVRRGLAASSAVVAPTRAMLQSLARDYGPLPRASVIENGRDAARFPPAEKEPLVLSAGRLWDEAKGVRVLLEAARGIVWPVEIAGPMHAPPGQGDDCAPPESVAAARFLGPLPSEVLAEHMGRASIYVLPARYEPFGLSLLEAALAGCALVAGDVPSLRELWRGCAEFVPPGDAAAVRRAVSDLIDDEPRRARLARAARARALALSPEAMARRYLALYESLGRAAAGPPSEPDALPDAPVDAACA